MTTCQHRSTTFSRDICPDPCGYMHTSCDDCHELLDDCAHDPANWTREQAQAAQAELDELERTDPDVAAAAASYDRMVERVTGKTIETVTAEERLGQVAALADRWEQVARVERDMNNESHARRLEAQVVVLRRALAGTYK